MNKQDTVHKTQVLRTLFAFLLLVSMGVSFQTASAQQPKTMVRISEIEIDPVYLEDYKTILAEEAAASVKLEPGVIAIFPMYQKENPASVRILEMYASQSAYEQHLKTPHFQTYKTTTLKMVKLVELVDMEALDRATAPMIFRKIHENNR